MKVRLWFALSCPHARRNVTKKPRTLPSDTIPGQKAKLFAASLALFKLFIMRIQREWKASQTRTAIFVMCCTWMPVDGEDPNQNAVCTAWDKFLRQAFAVWLIHMQMRSKFENNDNIWTRRGAPFSCEEPDGEWWWILVCRYKLHKQFIISRAASERRVMWRRKKTVAGSVSLPTLAHAIYSSLIHPVTHDFDLQEHIKHILWLSRWRFIAVCFETNKNREASRTLLFRLIFASFHFISRLLKLCASVGSDHFLRVSDASSQRCPPLSWLVYDIFCTDGMAIGRGRRNENCHEALLLSCGMSAWIASCYMI